MIKKSFKLGVFLALGTAVAFGWSDLKRYVKIRQISGEKLRPEQVPAEGHAAYPQRGGSGVPDGTGDFDSARRGGPARS
jgi:hypothetical protein